MQPCFHPPRKFPRAFWQPPPPPTPPPFLPAPGNYLSAFWPCSFPRIPCQWFHIRGYAICLLFLYLASFIYCWFLIFIHSVNVPIFFFVFVAAEYSQCGVATNLLMCSPFTKQLVVYSVVHDCAAMTIGAQAIVWRCIFIFLGTRLGVELLGCMFNLLRHDWAVSQSGRTISNPHQQHMNVLVAPCLCQHLVLSDFFFT